MRIAVNKKKCTGCHLCEAVCSIKHFGVVNPLKSAIRIEKDDLDTSMNKPTFCLQCNDMKCLTEAEAADGGPEREKVRFLWPGKRVELCPFNAIFSWDGKAIHCDLCGGDPMCVKYCTTKAIYLKD